MPPVPAVRGSQVVNALEKAGFVVGRINGLVNAKRQVSRNERVLAQHTLLVGKPPRLMRRR
jgi:predicted RNA binding protein YcfA (HicA-like mRNA interferase family)